MLSRHGAAVVGLFEDPSGADPTLEPPAAIRVFGAELAQLDALGCRVDELAVADVEADVGDRSTASAEGEDITRKESRSVFVEIAAGFGLVAADPGQRNALRAIGVLNKTGAIETPVGSARPPPNVRCPHSGRRCGDDATDSRGDLVRGAGVGQGGADLRLSGGRPLPAGAR